MDFQQLLQDIWVLIKNNKTIITSNCLPAAKNYRQSFYLSKKITKSIYAIRPMTHPIKNEIIKINKQPILTTFKKIEKHIEFIKFYLYLSN